MVFYVCRKAKFRILCGSIQSLLCALKVVLHLSPAQLRGADVETRMRTGSR